MNEKTIMELMSREIRLASRPKGLPTAANFTLARTALEPLRDQEVLVRNLFMSVDPYMRGRMNDGKSYVPPFELGKPLDTCGSAMNGDRKPKQFPPQDREGLRHENSTAPRTPNSRVGCLFDMLLAGWDTGARCSHQWFSSW